MSRLLLVKPPSHPIAFSFSSKVAFMVEIILDRVNDNDNGDNV